MKKKLSKKSKPDLGLNNWQKAGLAGLIVGTLAFVKIAYFSAPKEVVPEPVVNEQPAKAPTEDVNTDVPKSYVSVYFLGQNDNNEEVYKVVKRPYSAKSGTKLKLSIENLLQGPTEKEKAKGIYSEIPQGTKLISLEETPDKVVINLSSDFEQGGGTEGLYKRLYQLIKTSNKNTALNVYLYLNGKQVDVVGGEGIMINQPLNEKSLEE